MSPTTAFQQIHYQVKVKIPSNCGIGDNYVEMWTAVDPIPLPRQLLTGNEASKKKQKLKEAVLSKEAEVKRSDGIKRSRS